MHRRLFYQALFFFFIGGWALLTAPITCAASSVSPGSTQSTTLPTPTTTATTAPNRDTLSDPVHFSNLDNIDIGEYLNWVNDSTANSCGGYYNTQPMQYSGPIVAKNSAVTAMPLQIKADSAQFYLKGKSTLSGHVMIMQQNKQIIADNAYVYRGAEGNLQDVNMLGNVHLAEPGKLIIADIAAVPIKEEAISHFSLYDVIYRISLHPRLGQPSSRETGLIAWGYAKKIEQTAPDQLDFFHASYSTCPPDAKICTWHLTANNLHFNKTTGNGTAHHAVLWVRRLPVAYLPYFSFPIDDRRKSGFLYPAFSSSTNSGISFGIPYYLNLAPNYDLTLFPNDYVERGLYLSSEFRYLTANSTGKIDAGVLPQDKKFTQFQRTALTEYAPGDQLNTLESDSNTRTNLHWINNTQIDSHWSSHFDYSYVSDDYFLEDISQSALKASDNQLLQQADLNYYGEYWTFQGMLKNYETLHPINQDPIYNQYARLPELTFNADIPNQFPGVDSQVFSQFDYFYIQSNPDQATLPTTGYRFNFSPGVELPHAASYGYFTPGMQLNATSYQLSNPGDNNPTDPTRVLPLLDIDSGLLFDKNTDVFGKAYKQTLEPRLYYLYVPYQDQSNLPNFDSALYTLTYDQLFQKNRFSSVDRIGDANQIAYGATTRFVDPAAGFEKMNFSLGQLWYFENREVNLCTTTACQQQNTETVSPLVSQINYFLSSHWSFSGDAAYDATTADMNNASVDIHYKQDERRVINLGYSYVGQGNLYTTESVSDTNLANLSQVHASYAWPMTVQWNTLGSIDWDTSYTNGVSFMLGAEYSSCCWGVRFLVNQELTGVNNGENQYNRVYYVQFVLKGLGEVKTRDSRSMITQNIANYQNDFVQPF